MRAIEKQFNPESNLKGRMAESLVYDLLKESGNETYHIGFEATLPGLTRIDEVFNRHGAIGNKIRIIPDFFVLNKNDDPYLIEVKFRWSPAGHESDPERLRLIAKFWQEAVVVFVNCSKQPYFRYTTYPFFKKNGEIDLKPLDEFPPLRISENMLVKYEALVEKYLKPTLTSPLPKDSVVFEHPMQYVRPKKN